MKLECRQCGGTMVKTKTSSGNCTGVIFALIIIIIGIALLFVVPIGTIIGILLIIAGLFSGGKTRKVWKCKKCGAIIERA